MENRKLKKKTNQKPKNLQVYLQCSFSLNNFGVHLSLQYWRWCLRCCFVVVSSKGTHKVEQNYTDSHTHTHTHTHTQNPHQVSQVEMQYSFSKFFHLQV
jgi:hypothetical protein